ncbi:unnamed protein product [Brassica oleracea]
MARVGVFWCNLFISFPLQILPDVDDVALCFSLFGDLGDVALYFLPDVDAVTFDFIYYVREDILSSQSCSDRMHLTHCC